MTNTMSKSKGSMVSMISAVGLAFGLAFTLAAPGEARADAKADAQAKLDAAKTEVCEKAKTFLAGQEAKGKCAAENAEAKKLTCSAATFKAVTELQTRCVTAKPATATPATTGSTPAPVANPHCRALDPASKAVIAEAEDKLSTKCTRLLLEKLQAHWCGDAAAKGKSFDYLADFDHTLGTGKFARKLETKAKAYKCIKAGPAKK
jgi:hypothetical protein